MSEERRRAILEAADLASRPEPSPRLTDLLTDDDPIVTYWAAVGHRLHPALLTDETPLPEYPPARIEVSATFVLAGNGKPYRDELIRFAKSDNMQLRLQALQRIQDFGPKALEFRETLEACLAGGDLNTRSSAEVTLYMLGKRKLSY